MREKIKYTAFPHVLGAVVAVSGISVLCGWIFDIPLLKSIFSGLATMKVNTAIAFTLIGFALLFRKPNNSEVSWPVQICAALAAIIGLFTLAEYALQWDAGIDELFIQDHLTAVERYPGRPSHMTAFNFAILGIAYLISPSKSRGRVAEILSALGMLVAYVAIVGYVLDVKTLYGAAFYSSMALHTSILFILVSTAIWWGTSDNLLQKLLCASGSAGILARRMVPFALVVPIALSSLWLYGARAGLYDKEFGWALLVVTNVIFLIGFIIVAARPIKNLERERLNITTELENRAAELAAVNRRLESLSNTDPLTGVGNRRAFNARLTQELETISRYHMPLSLMLVDLDEFKPYNDEFGHAAGDDALVAVATILKDHARKTDFVARIGGDEFAIILTETNINGATIQAERFQHGIKSFDWPLRQITVSIGIAQALEVSNDFASLFHAADKALYRVKKDHGERRHA